jgi:O-antigen/teichoic acid export membrane protein
MEQTKRQVRGAALVGLAMTFGNVCAYAFVVAAAQLLSPATYGEVGAIMGLLLVLGVVALGLQAGAARTVASGTDAVTTIERRTVRSGMRAAAILLAGVVLLSPLLAMLLDLSSVATAVFAAFAAAELALMGAAAGLLQGEREWHGFAVVQLLNGIGRLVVAGGLVLLWTTASGAILGVALGNLLPMLAALLVLRRHTRKTTECETAGADDVPTTTAVDDGSLGFLAVLRDSHLLLATLVLTNVDILLARVVLTDHQSGLYAAGLIITKAVLFLPQFVITVAFPDMVERGARRALRITLLVVCGLGALTVIGVGVLAPVALIFVGGAEYVEVQGQLWLFAVLGTALSLVNVYVFRFLATARAHREWWVWGAVLVVLAASPLIGTVTQLLLVMIAVDIVLLGVLAWLESRDRRLAAERADSEPHPEPT